VLGHYKREVLVAMGARIAENVSFYVLTVFSLSYLTKAQGADSSFTLNALVVASAVHLVTIPLWGARTGPDRIGRRPVYLFGTVGMGVWAFALFGLLDPDNFWLSVAAITIGLLFHGAMYGPQAAFFAELFGTKSRYTGVGIGSQLASLVAGAPAPLIALALLGRAPEKGLLLAPLAGSGAPRREPHGPRDPVAGARWGPQSGAFPGRISESSCWASSSVVRVAASSSAGAPVSGFPACDSATVPSVVSGDSR
jgi:MFS family permease